ncbi:MAG: flagellar brake protein [Oscillospiraceae bacterium]
MNLERVLKTGHEVHLKGRWGDYIASVYKVTGKDTLSILVGGNNFMVDKGDKYSVSCITDRGLIMFEAHVVDYDDSGKNTIVELRLDGEYSCLQRRAAYRVRERIEVNARKRAEGHNPPEKWVKTNTVDISETGILLRYHEWCPEGQVMEFVIRIKMFDIDETFPVIRGRVVRCIETNKKKCKYLLGIAFENLPEKCRDVLIRLVILSQRNQLSYRNLKEHGQDEHGGDE